MRHVLVPVAAILAAITATNPAPVLAQAAQQGDAARGATLFQQRCSMCHTLAGKGGRLGPDLTGVIGRKAGATSFNYSPAMKASKTIWNKAALDTYLAAPAKAIPGSRMVISVAKPDERKAIISYLAASK